MSKFVDKVENKGEIFDIQDARVPEAAIEDAGKVLKVGEDGGFELGEGGGAFLDNESIVVAPIETPPVLATFDGVDYYHKCEFDLEELLVSENEGSNYDALTAEKLSDSPTTTYFKVAKSYGPMGTKIDFVTKVGGFPPTLVVKQTDGSYYVSSSDVNKEYEIDTLDIKNVCTHYYIQYDEDAHVIRAYYCLITDKITKINSVKAGDEIIPIIDDRIPMPLSKEQDKVLMVGLNGYEFGAVMKLYKHTLTFSPFAGSKINSIVLYSTNPNQITEGYSTIGDDTFIKNVAGNIDSTRVINPQLSYWGGFSPYLRITYLYVESDNNAIYQIDVSNETSITDTVTPL